MPYTNAGSVFPAPYTHGLDPSVPAGAAHLAPVDAALHQLVGLAPVLAAVGVGVLVILRQRDLRSVVRTRTGG
jgi:hypothetical protein